MKLINLIFLGLHINSRLTWDSHIKEVSTKIIRTTGIMKKLQLTFPKKYIAIHI